MNIDDDDFTLFGAPGRVALDPAQLDRRWRELQTEVHPDRFAAQGAAAQRIAMQWSVRVNQAYQRLKDPLKRAAYLCERRGAPGRTASKAAALPWRPPRARLCDSDTLSDAGAGPPDWAA